MSAVTSISPLSAGYPTKRLLDIVFSGALLLVLSPLLVVVAALVKATSHGPVLFRQRRLGMHELPFTILKFRSMFVDAQQRGPEFTVAGDPRITPLGRILRRTSLDELPQLINVFCGDMSLFGPRPYAGFELEGQSLERRAKRALVRPGISGLAQCLGRSTLDPEQTLQLDLQYVEGCSLSQDAWIFVKTLQSLLWRRDVN